MPGAEMPENLLDHPGVINHADHAHGAEGVRSAEWVDVPDLQDKIPPAFGGQFQWRRRGNAGATDQQLWRQARNRLTVTWAIQSRMAPARRLRLCHRPGTVMSSSKLLGRDLPKR